MPRFSFHQRVIDSLQGVYKRWGHSRRVNHSRHVDWLATTAARVAAPFFSDILWRVTPAAATRLELERPPPRTLYLTIDDGPTAAGTPAILETLDRHQVPATMFVVGQNARAEPGLIREVLLAGHGLGNHTETHCDAWSLLFPQVAQELARTDDLLAELAGMPVPWVRPPHGHFTAKLRAWCAEHKRRLVMWDVLPADYSAGCPRERVIDFVCRRVRGGSILVLHDNANTVGRAPRLLEELLPRLQDAGWQFDRLRMSAAPQPDRLQPHARSHA